MFSHFIAYAVVKKYYNFLWKSFPSDYSVTLARYNQAFPKKDKIDDRIMTCPNLEMGNLKILSLCILPIQKDNNLLDFYEVVETIINNPKLLKIMKVFKKGKKAVWLNSVAK